MEYVISVILSSFFSFYVIDLVNATGMWNIFGIFGAIFSITLLVSSYLKIAIAIYLKKIDEKKEIERIENELSKNIQPIEYYREAFDKYPPAIISLLLGKKNYDDLLVSMVLSLEQKGYIKIEDNNIIVLEKDTTDLMSHEKYFLSKYNELFLIIQNNKRIFFTSKSDKNRIKIFKQMIYEDAISLKLISKIKSTRKVPIFTNVLVIIGALLGYIPALQYFEEYSMLYFLLLFLMVILLLSGNSSSSDYSIARTELGLDLYNKLYGLKKFIVDFSNLNDNTIREFEMWKSYKISTILFNVNGTLNNEINQLFNGFASNCKTYVRIGKLPTIVAVNIIVILLYFVLLVPLFIKGNCEPLIILIVTLFIGVFLFFMNFIEY